MIDETDNGITFEFKSNKEHTTIKIPKREVDILVEAFYNFLVDNRIEFEIIRKDINE